MKRLGAWLSLAMTVSSVIVGVSTPSAAAEGEGGKKYRTVTLKGSLTDPTNQPMQGATVRFSPKDGGDTIEDVTNERGEFELRGLDYSSYDLSISTADGRVIRGIRSYQVAPTNVEVELKITERVQSDTTLTNEPQSIVIAVNKPQMNKKKFWTQFAIFFGVAGATAAASH